MIYKFTKDEVEEWIKKVFPTYSSADLAIAYSALNHGLSVAHATSLIIAAHRKRIEITEADEEKREEYLITAIWRFLWKKETWHYDYDKYIEIIETARDLRTEIALENRSDDLSPF